MIVKFHARGRGGGSGPVDYLLGKDRQRDGATVLQGKPEEIKELIDASHYSKKYTSGVLSFEETDLSLGQREQMMESFEQVLMPGLDKDQYSVLWVEHRDKGRIELNFLIPNTELLSGKRLQPYYDKADRPRINAWQAVANAQFALSDPNDPLKKRNLVTPNSLPKSKQEALETITRGLITLVSSGELKTRQDVTEALERSGFEVVRTTKNSISIADPDGGQNIRLKGALYEQSFNAGEGLRAEIERAAAEYRRDAENRLQRAREICHRGTELKRAENQRRHARPRPEAVISHERANERHVAHGQPNVADHRPSVCPVDSVQRGDFVVAGAADTRQLQEYSESEKHTGHAVREEQRRATLDLRRAEAALCEGEPGSGKIWRGFELDDTGGEIAHDRTGKTIIERIGAATAGLLEKAGRVGERLRGMAAGIWTYARGEHSTEQAHYKLEQTGAEFERATKPVVVRLNDIEQQKIKILAQERAQRYQDYDGPSLG